MRAELKSLFSLSHPHLDLTSWSPEGEPFGLGLTLFIGTEGDTRADAFDLTICTSEWLDAQAISAEYSFFGRILLVRKFDYASLKAELTRRCKEHSAAESWQDLAMQIDAWALWEFRYLYRIREPNGVEV